MQESTRRAILEARPQLEAMLKAGANTIAGIRDSGKIGAEILGTFKGSVDENTGKEVTDDITNADKVVGREYAKRVREYWPGWHCFIEDHPQPDPTRFKQGDIGLFLDPNDGTKLLIEDVKLLKEHGPESAERKLGYSTMAGVAVYEEGKGFEPVLGIVKVVDRKLGDGELVWAYHDGDETHLNRGNLKIAERKHDKPVFARTKVERKGILGPLTKTLQEKLGCEVKYIRGMAPQAMAFITGESDFFVYEPGITMSDLMPVIPMIRACGGEAFDLKGNQILYSGREHLDETVVIAKKGKIATKHGAIGKHGHVDRNVLLEAAASAYKP